MKRLSFGFTVLIMFLCMATSSSARLSVSVGLPNVSIGINLPLFPELVVVPGYPVYYAPDIDANYFFYDGMYWVYQDDNWYASYWYNGPWDYMDPEFVPLFILRIPVRYYRQPPQYFRGWRPNEAPRWDQHWGRDWERQRRGWNRWNRSSRPAPAPLPSYQRHYSGERYPRSEDQQHRMHKENYRYQPRDKDVRRYSEERGRRDNPRIKNSREERGTPQRPQPGRVENRQDRSPREQLGTPQRSQPGRVENGQERSSREPGFLPRQQPEKKLPVEEKASRERGGVQNGSPERGQDPQNDRERGRERRD